MPGRRVAQPGEKSENPDIELGPEEIEKLIAAERPQFAALADRLHDAASGALKAINNKNAKGLYDAGEGIDAACERCHLRYWYPNEVLPEPPK